MPTLPARVRQQQGYVGVAMSDDALLSTGNAFRGDGRHRQQQPPQGFDDEEESAEAHHADWAPPSRAAVSKTVALAAMGFFLFGYDTGVVSAALFYLEAGQNFGLSGFQKEVFVSACIAAAIVGSLLVSAFDKAVGRRTFILVSAAFFTVGALVMAVCPTDAFWVMVVGRAIVGLAIGASSSTVPVYISELAPPEIRGCLTVTNNAFCTGGQLCAAVIAYGLSFLDPAKSWRYMLGIGAIPAVGQAVAMFFMPESPRWLLLSGRRPQALQALRRLKHPGAPDAAIEAELE
jgi:MFS family permease